MLLSIWVGLKRDEGKASATRRAAVLVIKP